VKEHLSEKEMRSNDNVNDAILMSLYRPEDFFETGIKSKFILKEVKYIEK
jgi:hypothetical protein